MIETIKRIIDFNYKFSIKPKLVLPIILMIIANLVLLKYSSFEKSFLFFDQIQWIIVAIVAFVFFSYIRIDFIFQHSYKAYLAIFILLLLTLYFGSKFNNSQRWLSLGFMFQPSEIGKILFVFFIAKFLSNSSKNYSDSKIILIALIPTSLIVYLILKQPDLGTSLVYLFIVFPMLIWSGVRLSSILVFISPGISFLTSDTILVTSCGRVPPFVSHKTIHLAF